MFRKKHSIIRKVASQSNAGRTLKVRKRDAWFKHMYVFGWCRNIHLCHAISFKNKHSPDSFLLGASFWKRALRSDRLNMFSVDPSKMLLNDRTLERFAIDCCFCSLWPLKSNLSLINENATTTTTKLLFITLFCTVHSGFRVKNRNM